jgi:hypothetical protein
MTEMDDLILHKYLTNKNVERYCWELEFYEFGKDMISSPHFHLRFKTDNRIDDANQQSKYIEQVLDQ